MKILLPRFALAVLLSNPAWLHAGAAAVDQEKAGLGESSPAPSTALRLTGPYLGQRPPGATPEVFARDLVSGPENEHALSFSPDGTEVFWFSNRPPAAGQKEWLLFHLTMRLERGSWTAPSTSPFPGSVAFSPDGRRVFFAFENDLWAAERVGEAWGNRRSLRIVARFPQLKAAYLPSVADSGALYFYAQAPGLGLRGNFGIYRSALVDGDYAKPQLLPTAINRAPFLNWAPFVARDESYLLFSSNRRDPAHDPGDLYLSRRLADGGWTEPVSLGEPVNTPRQEVFPSLSPDGKYLFFARDTPDHQNDVYWVDAVSIPALTSAVTDSQPPTAR